MCPYTLKRSLERRAERAKRTETEDFDGEEMEALKDEQAGFVTRGLHSFTLELNLSNSRTHS